MIIRSHTQRAAAIVLLLLLPLAGASGFSYSDNSPTLSTLDEIKAEFAGVVCKNDKREPAVRALFEKMGAAASDITVEKFGGVENLVIRKAGTTAETVIIGAHYDKVPDGCGAIDNWSGIVALAHLYRSLRNLRMSKTLLFVAFGKEEQGLLGSHAMVKAMSKEQAAAVCAMVNLDSFGMGAAQAAANMSSKKLSESAAKIAERMKIPFGNAAIADAEADSMSFMDRGIPAITLHGVTNGWEKVLHTDNDKPAKVDAVSVYLGYRVALALTVEIINAPCGAWR
jgi:Zn-dependent M28 family amino/carboxypeptidase